jgi:ribonuclease J
VTRTKSRDTLRVIPLGGLDEIGKNMTVFEYGDDMVVVDAGLMFPDAELPGVDLVLPDYSYILQNRERLRGIVITHGHEDHTGALPYLLRDLGTPVPVLGSKLTLGLIEGKLAEFDIRKPKLRLVKPGMHVTLGAFGFDFVPTNHSIPDSLALIIRTPVGTVLHTGDFKFDQTPIDGRGTDFAALTKAGRDGVLLMLSDSTGAESRGFTRSEREVGDTLHRIISAAKGRVIVASFSSHIHRVQMVCDAAVDAGRKVVVTGRSMIKNTGIARELGFLSIAPENILDAFEAGDLPDEKTVILSTGSQGEPLSGLTRMANGDHRTITVREGDTIIISASPIPGNERAVSRVISRLAKTGAQVFHKGVADVHVSGHASAEELKLMLAMVRPRYFMPVHGETRHLVAHSNLAESVGIAPYDIFAIENGDVLELTAGSAKVSGHIKDSGVVYVDGLNVGDVGDVVLRDRQQLSSEGVATVVIAVDGRTRKFIGEPELVMRGLPVSETDDLMVQARARINKALKRMEKEGVTDHSIIQRAVREAVSQFVWETLRRRPMIVPVIMEV